MQGQIDAMNYGSLPDELVGELFLANIDTDFEKAKHEHRQARGENLGRDVSSNYLFEVTKANAGSCGPSSI